MRNRNHTLFFFLVFCLKLTFSVAPVHGGPTVTLRGQVLDESGAVVPGAAIAVFYPGGSLAASVRTDASGVFVVQGLGSGRYEVEATQPGLAPMSVAVNATEREPAPLVFRLRVGAVTSQVTVTAARGMPVDAAEAPNGSSVVAQSEQLIRPALILPQVLRGEPGVQLQQTSSHQGAVLIRGLTGQQVLHLIDGVRYNTSTFRPGPNQYLATVDPGFVERLEVSRGPNSTQYGSDSLGGTLNLLPARPFAGKGGRKFQGEFSSLFRSADLAGGGGLRLAYGDEKLYVLGGGSFRRGQDLMPGGGRDSHAAVTRFLGLPSRVLGERLQDTAFTQWGGYARLFWNARQGQSVSATYHRGEQLGGSRYDQLNGGNGNLLNSFDPQVLDFFYTRYEKQQLGWLDSLQGTFSVNRQRDDRRFQGGSGNPLAAITEDDSDTRAFGYQLQGTAHAGPRHVFLFGGEAYDEYVAASAEQLDPVTGTQTEIRGRFPNGTRYRSWGLFLQHTSEWFNGRLRTQSGVRYSNAWFRTIAARNLTTTGSLGVPDFATAMDDVTFQTGASYRLAPFLSLFGSVSRGFRAPNVTDFSSVGLTSNGFEVSPDQAAQANALIGTTANASAVSSGAGARQLAPESLLDYEGGLRLHTNRVWGSVSLFHYGVQDFITRRAILLPAGAVGTTIGGQTIIQQLASGAVITGADPRPVITRANVGEVRIRGFEGDLKVKLGTPWLLSASISYLRGVDVATGNTPDIEGGLPPLNGYVSLRWQPAGRAFWLETFSFWSDAQDRLSSIELADQRIGASRSRSSIAAFFNNGAVARGLVAGGILLATGETLAQVQDRVLGVGVQSAPLFLSTPGFATMNFRGGYRVGERSEVIAVFENVLDRNYRLHGSGVDGPGRNLQLTYLLRF
jgi:outer membrane receptor protein involved in Fe transport